MRRAAHQYGRALKDRRRIRATALALSLGSDEGLPRTALAKATWQLLKGTT